MALIASLEIAVEFYNERKYGLVEPQRLSHQEFIPIIMGLHDLITEVSDSLPKHLVAKDRPNIQNIRWLIDSLANHGFLKIMTRSNRAIQNYILQIYDIDLHLPNYICVARQDFNLVLRWWYKAESCMRSHIFDLFDTDIEKCEEMTPIMKTKYLCCLKSLVLLDCCNNAALLYACAFHQQMRSKDNTIWAPVCSSARALLSEARERLSMDIRSMSEF